jgi:AcrB/AcrD/AcrF family/Protein of unknown function (DUF1348)
MKAADAAIEAARLRLRPILMTSFALSSAWFHWSFASGAGAEMRQALGTVVFFGMIGVTFFGVFLTPVFYTVIRRLTDHRVVPAERPIRSVPAAAGGGVRPAVGRASVGKAWPVLPLKAHTRWLCRNSNQEWNDKITWDQPAPMATRITPPFTLEAARAKVKAAENTWNTRDPEIFAQAYKKILSGGTNEQGRSGPSRLATLGLRNWDLFLNMGLAQLEDGYLDPTTDSLRRAVLLGEDHLEARFNLALAVLAIDLWGSPQRAFGLASPTTVCSSSAIAWSMVSLNRITSVERHAAGRPRAAIAAHSARIGFIKVSVESC